MPVPQQSTDMMGGVSNTSASYYMDIDGLGILGPGVIVDLSGCLGRVYKVTWSDLMKVHASSFCVLV
jgi:hypothetical protein